MSVLLAVMFLAAAPPAEPVVPPSQPAWIMAIEQALKSNPELAQHHAGYLGYLREHPELANAESAFSDIASFADTASAFGMFDESLMQDHEAERLFNQHYEALSRHPSLRKPVDRIYRWELSQRTQSNRIAPALEHLRSHPDTTIPFLESKVQPRVILPELGALWHLLRQDKNLQQGLLGGYQSLQGMPQAHTSLYPWWQQQANAEGKTSEHFSQFQRHLSDKPRHFWVWHEREIALANKPHARDWIRYWRRLVRRVPEVAPYYENYLKSLRKKGNTAASQSEAAWPPDGNPPPIAPLPEEAHMQYMRVWRDGEITSMNSHQIARPAMPAMPQMPQKPARPEKAALNTPNASPPKHHRAMRSPKAAYTRPRTSRPAMPVMPTMPQRMPHQSSD